LNEGGTSAHAIFTVCLNPLIGTTDTILKP
jgi:hypothetical protein